MLSRSRGSFCSRFVLAKEMMKSAAEAFFSHSMRSSPLSALLQGPISLICSLRTQMVRDAQAQKHRGPMLRVGGHDTASSVCLHPHIAATENGSTGSYRKFCTISIPSMYTLWWRGINNDFDGAAECTGLAGAAAHRFTPYRFRFLALLPAASPFSAAQYPGTGSGTVERS